MRITNTCGECRILDRLKELSKDKMTDLKQGGAPPHRAKISAQVLENNVSLVKDWPMSRPNLSVIENL
jgi:hypothetical protein